MFAKGAELISPAVNAEETPRDALRVFIKANVDFFAHYPNYGRAVMNITRSGAAEQAFDPSFDQPRQTGFRAILEWGQRTGAFRAFSTDVMATSIIEALDIIPKRHGADPDLDLDAYAAELVELFDRATRADPPTKE